MIRLIVNFSDAGSMMGGNTLPEEWSEIFEIEHPALEEALRRKMPYGAKKLTFEERNGGMPLPEPPRKQEEPR